MAMVQRKFIPLHLGLSSADEDPTVSTAERQKLVEEDIIALVSEWVELREQSGEYIERDCPGCQIIRKLQESEEG